MKKTYQTGQRKSLVDFLKNNQDKQFTIAELANALAHLSIGKSTIYRLINNLCNEGLVLRTSQDNSSSHAYRFLGGSECHSHLHLKCLDCGNLFHLENELSEHLYHDILKGFNFQVDEHQTMIVGRCKDCSIIKEVKI